MKLEQLTECFHRLQVLLPWVQDFAQPLVGAIGNGGVNDQDQTRPQSSPETSPAILAVDHVHGSSNHALALCLGHGLLPRCHYRHGNGEQLGEGTGYGTKRELDRRARRCLQRPVGHVQGPHNGVPVEVGKVGRGHTEQRASHAGIQARQTLLGIYFAYRVERTIIVFFVGGVGTDSVGGALDLNL